MGKPDSLKELDKRLHDAKVERHRDRAGLPGRLAGSNMTGFGMAFRVGAELVSALIVGVGIGYMLDNWLDTAPWLLIVFFFIGAGAGILNVYRAADGLVGDGMEIDDYPCDDDKKDS